MSDDSYIFVPDFPHAGDLAQHASRQAIDALSRAVLLTQSPDEAAVVATIAWNAFSGFVAGIMQASNPEIEGLDPQTVIEAMTKGRLINKGLVVQFRQSASS